MRTVRAVAWFALLLGLLISPAAVARDYAVFDVVGDSISAGVNPEAPGYGWVQMLFGQSGGGDPPADGTITSLWPSVTCYNSAVSGSRAAQWAEPGHTNMQVVLNHHPDLVVVFIGGNDFLFYAADGVITESEIQSYRTNLVTIIRCLRANTPVPEIIVVDYYDLFDGYSANLTGLLIPLRCMSPVVPAGDQLIADVAAEEGCFFVDIYDDFMHHCYGAELGDTNHLSPDYVRTPLASFDIHPVTAGHRKICERVYERMLDLKDIPRFVGIERGTNAVTLRWSAGINQSYVIQRSTNLLEGFTSLATNASAPTCNTYTDTVGTLAPVYYRIQVTP